LAELLFKIYLIILVLWSDDLRFGTGRRFDC
jgi:hypothetical protein